MRPEIVFAGLFLIGVLFLVGAAIVHLWRQRRKVKSEDFIEVPTGTPVEKTKGGKLFATVGLANQCPDCKGHGFYEGPSGGMSTNIFCMNRECRSGFNITWFTQRQGTCDRISKGDIGGYPNA